MKLIAYGKCKARDLLETLNKFQAVKEAPAKTEYTCGIWFARRMSQN